MATQQRNSQLQYGLALERAELEALDNAGVRAQTRVTPVRQPKGNLVLTCEESGGGAKDIGHYVGYLPLQGHPVVMSRKLFSLGKNSLHRRIVATTIVRFEVFRYRENYVHVWITLHRTHQQGNEAKRDPVTRQTLFRGKFGELDGGTTMFPSEDGTEDIQIPSFFLPGYEAALAGTRCRGCQHAGHFVNVPNLKLPDGLLAALRVSEPKAAPEAAPEATPGADQKQPAPKSRTRGERSKPIAVGDPAAD